MLIAASLALVLTALSARHVLVHPATWIAGTEVVGRHHDPYTVIQQFAGMAIPLPYLQPVTDWLGRAIARIVPPVAAYNAIVLSSFPLAAWFAYLFALEATGDPAAAVIAALLFAFAPFHFAHAAYHPHVAQVQWIPLYFLALWRLAVRGVNGARIAGVAVAGALVTLSNFYGGFIAIVLTPVSVVAFWLANRRGRRALDLLAMSAALGAVVAVAAIAAWTLAPNVLRNPQQFAVSRDELFVYSARWWSYVLPAIDHPVLGAWARGRWAQYGIGAGLLEQQVSIGWSVLALSAIALAARVRDVRAPRLQAVVPLLAIAATAVVCSLGPERQIGGVTIMRPSALLYRLAPMFRAYARFAVVAQLTLSATAGIGAAWLWSRGRPAPRAIAALLVLCAAVEYAPWAPRGRDVLPTTAHRWIVGRDEGARVFDCSEWAPSERATEWLAGYPIGYLQPTVPDCGEPALASKLRASGFRDLIVRAGTPEFEYLRRHGFRDLTPGFRGPDADVFAIASGPAEPYVGEIRGAYPREYLGGRSWRWAGLRLELDAFSPASAAEAFTLRVELTAFALERHVTVSLNGQRVASLVVPPRPQTFAVGPLSLLPGANVLDFASDEPPTVADTVARNGDTRALSLAVGEWQWRRP